MPKPSLSSIIRNVLTENPSNSTDELIIEVKRRGRKDSDERIRSNIYSVRKHLKKQVTAALTTSTSSTTPVSTTPAVQLKEADHTMELSAVLANVVLVNRALGAVGGIENARQVAEAVRSCGSVELFLQHLETVAGIRTAE